MPRTWLAFTAAALALLMSGALPSPVQGAAGELDSTFGGKGWVSLPDTKTHQFPHASDVAVETDGKPVTVGTRREYRYPGDTGGPGDIVVARHNEDGSLDEGFSEDGMAIFDFDGSPDSIGSELEIDPAGDIWVLGIGYGGNTRVAGLARLRPDGSLDASFSDDGELTFPLGDGYDFADIEGLAVSETGAVIVGMVDEPSERTAVLRINPAGKVDTSFSGDGMRTFSFEERDPPGNRPTDVAIDRAGRIVLSGYTFEDHEVTGAVARLLPDGRLDRTFSRDGRFLHQDMAPEALLLRPGGGIALVADSRLARINRTGSLNHHFSGNGITKVPFEVRGECGASLIDIAIADALLMVGGRVGCPYGGMGPRANLAFARVDMAGQLDSAFSSDGMQEVSLSPDGSFSSLIEHVSAVAVDTEGRLVFSAFMEHGGITTTGFITGRLTD